MNTDAIEGIATHTLKFTKGTKVNPTLFERHPEKPVIFSNGDNIWPEIAMLGNFRKQGYEGYWVDTFPQTVFWKSQREHASYEELPPGTQTVLEGVRKKNNGFSGCWDLVAWNKAGDMKYIELLGPGEVINQNQIDFMNNLVKSGTRRDAFLIIGWDYSQTF